MSAEPDAACDVGSLDSVGRCYSANGLMCSRKSLAAERRLSRSGAAKFPIASMETGY